jgi:hypothetical protein
MQLRSKTDPGGHREPQLSPADPMGRQVDDSQIPVTQ